MFKIFKNTIMRKGIKLIYICSKNTRLFSNYNIKILQHEILYIQYG